MLSSESVILYSAVNLEVSDHIQSGRKCMKWTCHQIERKHGNVVLSAGEKNIFVPDYQLHVVPSCGKEPQNCTLPPNMTEEVTTLPKHDVLDSSECICCWDRCA